MRCPQTTKLCDFLGGKFKEQVVSSIPCLGFETRRVCYLDRLVFEASHNRPIVNYDGSQ